MTTRITGVIRVAVIDDQPLLVSTFGAFVVVQPDMGVVLEAVNGRQAVESLTVRATSPHGGADLVPTDLRMPAPDGISAIRGLCVIPATAALRILVLTTFNDEDLVLAALGAGAHGFPLKDAEPTTLLEVIRVVTGGGFWLGPAVTRTVLAHLDAGTGPGAPPSSTPPPAPPSVPADGTVSAVGAPSGPYEAPIGWEDAILALVCQGLSNASIGERLHVVESTIKSHVKTTLGETGCRNRVEFVIYALTTGLVQPRQLSLPGRRWECGNGRGLYPWWGSGEVLVRRSMGP